MGKRAVFLALDNSGSMSGQREAALRVGLASLYQRMAAFLSEPGNSLDLAVSLWGAVVLTRTYRDVNTIGLSFALSRLSEVDASFGGTDFEIMAPDALAFFEGTLGGDEYESRKFVFLTDGEAPSTSADAAAAILAGILDQSTGDFRTEIGTQVDCHAANIDQPVTTQTAKLDNTSQDGVPNIFGGNDRALAAYLRAIILPIEKHRLWTFPIEWGASYTEELAYRTEIILSRDGSEQRIAQRTKPRANYTFSSLLRTEASRMALRRASHRQGYRYVVQHPYGVVRLSAAASAGDTTLVIDRAPPSWVSPGSFMVLAGEDGVSFLATIIGVSGQNVFLATGLDQNYPADTPARQGVEGRFAGATDIAMPTNRVAQISVDFDADPVDTFVPDYGTAPVTLSGVEYFDLAPNWATPVNFTFEQEAEVIDEQRGAVDVVYPVAHTVRLVKMRYLCATKEKLDRLLGLYHRARGRQKKFFMPLFVDEMRPLGDSLTASGTITFSGREIADAYGEYLSYRKILVRRHQMEDLILTVTSITVDGAGNSVFQLASALLEDVLLADIRSVMWVAPTRFASDLLTIEWRADGTAEIETNMSILEEADGV